MKSTKMGFPMLKKCCWCLSLEVGCLALCIASLILCVANIVAGSILLPWYKTRAPEDNLISMSMVMFSTLSLISNMVVLVGMITRRPGCLLLPLLFNSVFIVCIFLVAVVTCLFSPELEPFMRSPGNIALVVVMLILGAAYSLYYLIAINSLYRKMKGAFGSSAIPTYM